MTPGDRDNPWLALDIGGANIKAAHESGPCLTRPFALWRAPGDLPGVLRDLLGDLPRSGRIALTMTAELCDCFASKAEGVQSILDAAVLACEARPIDVWCTDGRFRDVHEASGVPALVAAANWLALAETAARRVGPGVGLLIDVGSTTTDVIPLAGGRARPRGRTDTDRLATGELIYAGARRTPVCALAAELPFRGRPTGLAAELFATTLDVYLTLGEIPPDPDDLATADGRPATSAAARDRLARMVGADGDTFSTDDARDLARAAHGVLLARLESSARRALAVAPSPPTSAVVAGSGEFLARALALRLLPPGSTILGLRDLWGPDASSAACARALLELVRDRPPAL